MSIPFWDSWYKFLLERLEVEFPGLPEESKINQALGDLQLMACGIEAENSLVVSRVRFPDFRVFFRVFSNM